MRANEGSMKLICWPIYYKIKFDLSKTLSKAKRNQAAVKNTTNGSVIFSVTVYYISALSRPPRTSHLVRCRLFRITWLIFNGVSKLLDVINSIVPLRCAPLPTSQVRLTWSRHAWLVLRSTQSKFETQRSALKTRCAYPTPKNNSQVRLWTGRMAGF